LYNFQVDDTDSDNHVSVINNTKGEMPRLWDKLLQKVFQKADQAIFEIKNRHLLMKLHKA